MQARSVPTTGLRYWSALSIASVFGANLGDFVSHDLHLGHTRGLPPLALILGIILLLERRSRAGHEAFYWLAIVTLRTAATNLADLATHDLKLGYGWVVAALAALLAGALAFGRRGLVTANAVTASGVNTSGVNTSGPFASGERRDGIPATDARYWTAMLTAGTLGTALGDALADDWGLGVGAASVILGIILAAMFSLRARQQAATERSYWLLIVAIRTTGTTVGDLLADTVGLPVSTVVTGLLLAGLLTLWQPRSKAQLSRA